MLSNARSFTFIDGQTTRFWSVSQNSNQLIISQGLSGSPQSEIAQDFESQESAKLAMLELISEKVKAGYIEDKLSIVPSISNNSRRLPIPEHTTAQPTHLIRAKTFKLMKTDYPWIRTWKITVVWIENTFKGNHQIVVKLFDRPYGVKSSSLFKLKFVSSYSNTEEAEKAFAEIKDLDDLKQHVTSSNVVLLDRDNAKASESDSSSMKLFLPLLFDSKSIQKVEIIGRNFEQISLDRFNELATEVHDYLKSKQRRLDNYNAILAKFTIVAIRKLADMVSNDSIEDSWERARGFDGSIDFSKVSAESALLYAFASTGHHQYGYWVYVKQIVKALEKSGKHLQVLGRFYASFDSPVDNKNYKWRRLGDSVSDWEIFGSGSPSIATYRYMQRRARRHLDYLLQKDSESHALMMMIVLSETSYGHYYKSVDDRAWIFAHLFYGKSWRDGNHGRKIYLPDSRELENNLGVSPEVVSRLSVRQLWLSQIFSKSTCMPAVVFSYQILSKTNSSVPIEKNIQRLNFLVNSKNLELLTAVADIFDRDLDFLVENFKYNTQYLVDYSSRSDESLKNLLDVLISKDEWWSKTAVQEILSNLSISKLREILIEIVNHPKWSKDYLSAKMIIELLMSNFDDTVSLLGKDVLTTVKGRNLDAWIQALKSLRMEEVSNEQLVNFIPLIKPALGTNLELQNGLYSESTSHGLRVLIEEISKQKGFGNLTRLLIAQSKELKSVDASLHVGVVVLSLIKSESDFVSALKWSDELGARDVFLDLSKVNFAIVPWQSAVKKRVADFLSSDTCIAEVFKGKLSINYIASLASSLEAPGFFDNVNKVSAHRTMVISNLSDELLRSDDPTLVSFILNCYEDLLKVGKSKLQILFDLSASQSLDIQAMGLRLITELKFEHKTWIRLLESRLPLATSFAKQYVSTLSGTDFDNAVLVCLDSTVASAREVGLSLLGTNSSRMDIEALYVKLAENTDPYLAALVAARALEPGISDSIALDKFDRRVMKVIRQSRRAKELVKARRLNDVSSGERISGEIESLISDLAVYGNDQDSDWAIEMKSFISSASTSADALKLSGKDN
jgi:predicted DNA-binding WGR domain protein